jgi:hypothetical protein
VNLSALARELAAELSIDCGSAEAARPYSDDVAELNKGGNKARSMPVPRTSTGTPGVGVLRKNSWMRVTEMPNWRNERFFTRQRMRWIIDNWRHWLRLISLPLR